ncbi:hypothetical protein HCA99_06610 [Listeria booriae]|uniref:hypothetical protein n=1 Tax=Listeria booriae TaxID=1552123 RepID=UPI001624B6FB|nr:hypothetical protein [Listeria booriae]MBC2078882.1 hypothetical protein [Listeria booriae]
MKKVVTILAIGTMSLSAFIPLAHAEAQVVVPNEIEQSEIKENDALPESLVEGLDKYVEFTGDKYILNIPADVKSTYSVEEIMAVQTQIDESNSFLSVAEEDSHTYVDESAKTTNFLITDSEVLKAAGQKPMLRAAGVTKVVRYWWGMKIYLSKTFLNYSGGSLTGMAGYMVSKLPLKHPFALLAAGAMGAIGVFGTSAKHGYVIRITGISTAATVTGIWRQ